MRGIGNDHVMMELRRHGMMWRVHVHSIRTISIDNTGFTGKRSQKDIFLEVIGACFSKCKC